MDCQKNGAEQGSNFQGSKPLSNPFKAEVPVVVLRKHARLLTGHLDISKAVIKSRNSESLIYYLCISVGLLYKCEPPQKVWFFSHFIFLETSVDFYGRGHTSCRVSNFIDTFFILKKFKIICYRTKNPFMFL